jgi:predicted nucleic acid-binding protein
MKRLFVDTGAWYALVDREDPYHERAKSFYEKNRLLFVTTNFVFDEAVTLIMNRLGWRIAAQFGAGLKESRLVGLSPVLDIDEDRAWEVFLRYKDAGFSYTDCTSFSVMDRLKVDTVFGFDSHFRVKGFHVTPE